MLQSYNFRFFYEPLENHRFLNSKTKIVILIIFQTANFLEEYLFFLDYGINLVNCMGHNLVSKIVNMVHKLQVFIYIWFTISDFCKSGFQKIPSLNFQQFFS